MPLYLALAALLLGVAAEVTVLGRTWTLSYIDAVGVGVGVAGAVAAWRRRSVRFDLALLGYLGLLAVLGVQVLVRDDPASIVGGSSRFITAALLLFGLGQLARDRPEDWGRLWRWPVAVATFGSVLALWVLVPFVQALADPELTAFYDVKRSVATPLGSSNFLAAFLLVALLVVLVHAVEQDRRWYWPTALVLVGLLATMSRGAFGAGLLVLIGLAVVWRGRHRLTRAAAAVGVAAVTFGLIATLAASFTSTSNGVRSASADRPVATAGSRASADSVSGLQQLDGLLSDIAIGGRRQLYRDSWEAFVDHPFVGVGVNQLPTYTGRGGHPPHDNAHNLELHALATTGLFGAVAYLGVWVVLVWRLWAVSAGTARTALVAGMAALFLHAQVEALSHTRAVEALVVVVLAIVGSAPGARGVRELGSGHGTQG